jgi:DNA replication protein DnaC
LLVAPAPFNVLDDTLRALRLACFPYAKALEQFDFSLQLSINHKLVRELAGLGFVERGDNLLLLGPPGTCYL